MRPLFMAAAAAATLAMPMAPAIAQHNWDHGHHDNGRHDNGYHWDHRPPRADWHRYDWNHHAPGENGYYADRYYVERGYRPVRVNRYTRVYRGYDGRYYCRRSDGTTGLIAGAALGGLLGNSLSNGRSVVLSTVLGGAAGSLIGRDLDHGSVVCR